MKIVLLLVFAIAGLATTAALERRRVDQVEGNKLRDVGVNDERDKRHLFGGGSSLHASRTTLKKLGLKHRNTHSVLHKRYGGLRGIRPSLGLGSALSHTTNRQTFGAGIRGPLGGTSIYGSSYNRALASIRGK